MPVSTAPRKSMEPWLLDGVTFYDHQIKGVRKLMRMKSFLLADEMGLGKSLQALTVFVGDVLTGQGEVCLIVCPVTLRTNWSDEITKFTRIPHMLLGEELNPYTGKTRTLTSSERSRQVVEFFTWTGPRILVLNYEQVGAHLEELNALQARCVVFDEAHTIKNPEAKRTKACLELEAQRSFILTGSPILNQVQELWPFLNRIAPDHFPNYYAFRNRYCVFGGFKNKQIVGVKNQRELQRILDQVMIRRLKKDVLDLPEVQYVQIPVQLHPTQRKLYEQVDEELILESVDPNASPAEIDNAMVQMLRLKQVCGTPATLGFPDESYKLDAVVAKAKEILLGGHKLVVFTQFRPVLECISRRLREENLPVMELHGGVPKHERQDVVNQWATYPGSSVINCMIQVAGVGLNMTAARHAFFVDKLFVPLLNRQGVDRLHRIGQSTTQPVQVFEFIARGTVESRIEAILRSKMKLIGNVLDGAGVVTKLLQALREKE